jgi:flagellar M-ring protein FliF
MVRISATLDFSKVEKTEEFFDGDDPVIRSEQVNQELSGGETDGGVPGVESNLQGNVFGENTAGPNASKSSRTTNYEISKTISRIINPVGTITKLSVSVLVADRVELDADGKVKEIIPRSAEELKSIEDMVASAIGIVAERGDMINVISMPFVAPKEEAVTVGSEGESTLYQFLPMIKYGLIALGALLIYFLLIRPVVKTMKGEVKEHYKTVEQLEREQKLLQQQEKVEPEMPAEPVDDTITQLRREVNQNQVPTAFIIKNWIQEG